MEREYENKPEIEDLKTCQFCINTIYTDFKYLKIFNKDCYYHPVCYTLMLKKMERLGFLYSY